MQVKKSLLQRRRLIVCVSVLVTVAALAYVAISDKLVIIDTTGKAMAVELAGYRYGAFWGVVTPLFNNNSNVRFHILSGASLVDGTDCEITDPQGRSLHFVTTRGSDSAVVFGRSWGSSWLRIQLVLVRSK